MISALSVIAVEPNWLIMLPFGILLLAIAFGPLIAQHHWDRYYHTLCIVLAGLVCLYHLFVVQEATRVLHAGIDYLTFMVVAGSFFVVSGGIRLRVRAPSGPVRNTLFLFFGAVLANLIGCSSRVDARTATIPCPRSNKLGFARGETIADSWLGFDQAGLGGVGFNFFVN